jgi:8-amino-7-oxononanoate synthase
MDRVGDVALKMIKLNHALDWMQEELNDLQERSQYRELHVTSTEDGTWIDYKGRRVLNLSSNNYLGISFDPKIIDAVLTRFQAAGMGATASRLVVGNHPLYVQAEEALAKSKQTEAALIFPNGYMANLGAISSIVGREDTVYSDSLNHASIIDGIKVSRAQVERYNHNDLDHLESLLKKSNGSRGGKKLIVTDTVFSMDGDVAPLAELVQLKERYGAMLMIDEAHSGGIYGPHGEGLAYHHGLQERVDIHMGTFSKAYGCYGAYVVGSKVLREYLINKARSFIFTTGLPPIILSCIVGAIEIVKNEDDRRTQLQKNADYFRNGIQSIGFDTLGSETQIIPAVIGENEATVRFSKALLEKGIGGVAIRPPTVAEGMARIRFTVMATHREEDLTWALEQIKQIAREQGILLKT